MKKNIAYLIVIALLLFLNLFQIARNFRFPKPNFHENAIDAAAKVMQLTEEQKQQLDHFATQHRRQIDSLQRRQKEVISLYFEQSSDLLLNEIAQIEQSKIKITQQHFADIKSIMRKEQLPYFEAFKSNAIMKILRKDLPRPPFPQ